MMNRRPLEGKIVLVVEDEPFIAYDIIDGVENAGGNAVGPAGTVKSALQAIDLSHIDTAILDVNLHDGDVGPVVAELKRRLIPFIFNTGAGLTAELQRQHSDIRVFHKPTPPEVLAEALGLLLEVIDSDVGNEEHKLVRPIKK